MQSDEALLWKNSFNLIKVSVVRQQNNILIYYFLLLLKIQNTSDVKKMNQKSFYVFFFLKVFRVFLIDFYSFHHAFLAFVGPGTHRLRLILQEFLLTHIYKYVYTLKGIF